MTTTFSSTTSGTITIPHGVKPDALTKNVKIRATYIVDGARVTFSGSQAVLDSTDGRVAARVQLPASGNAPDGASAIIPTSLLKPAPKGKTATTITVTEGQCCRTTGDVQSVYSRPVVDRMFPNVEAVYPATAEVENKDLYHFVRVNPELLARLFDAMGANDAVGLFIPRDTDKAILATCGSGIGLVMPLTTDWDKRNESETDYRNLSAQQPVLSPTATN